MYWSRQYLSTVGMQIPEIPAQRKTVPPTVLMKFY